MKRSFSFLVGALIGLALNVLLAGGGKWVLGQDPASLDTAKEVRAMLDSEVYSAKQVLQVDNDSENASTYKLEVILDAEQNLRGLRKRSSDGKKEYFGLGSLYASNLVLYKIEKMMMTFPVVTLEANKQKFTLNGGTFSMELLYSGSLTSSDYRKKVLELVRFGDDWIIRDPASNTDFNKLFFHAREDGIDSMIMRHDGRDLRTLKVDELDSSG